MTDRDERRDEEPDIEEEQVADLEVPEEEADDVVGGRMTLEIGKMTTTFEGGTCAHTCTATCTGACA